VAVRGTDDRFTAIGGTGSTLELQRWLEHDGDIRAVRDVASGNGFRCDASGCTVAAKGQLIAAARHASALTDDCAQATVVVMPFPSPQNCGPKIR
jgi:competence protein ComEC